MIATIDNNSESVETTSDSTWTTNDFRGDSAPVRDSTPRRSRLNGVTDAAERSVDPERNLYAIYMREICQYKLLTAAQEIELGRRIQRGDAAAREQMILSNLRLVVKIAHGYENPELPLLDLINEGNLGLITAVERFDPERGSRFSTYGAIWIKQRIRRALMNKSRAVRLPVHVFERNFRLQRVAARLQSELEREPTTEELAGELGLSEAQMKGLKHCRLTITSLDAPLPDRDDETYASHFADERAIDPGEEATKQSQLVVLEDALSFLTERERKILRHRFGLDEEDPRTLEDISKDFGLTRERIRQIQCVALSKLRRCLENAEKANKARVHRSDMKRLLSAKAA